MWVYFSALEIVINKLGSVLVHFKNRISEKSKSQGGSWTMVVVCGLWYQTQATLFVERPNLSKTFSVSKQKFFLANQNSFLLFRNTQPTLDGQSKTVRFFYWRSTESLCDQNTVLKTHFLVWSHQFYDSWIWFLGCESLFSQIYFTFRILATQTYFTKCFMTKGGTGIMAV